MLFQFSAPQKPLNPFNMLNWHVLILNMFTGRKVYLDSIFSLPWFLNTILNFEALHISTINVYFLIRGLVICNRRYITVFPSSLEENIFYSAWSPPTPSRCMSLRILPTGFPSQSYPKFTYAMKHALQI